MKKILMILLFLIPALVIADACYTNVQNIPANCTGGVIVNDTFDGCRHITCANGQSSMTALACDKPDTGTPQNFELYKQSQTGTALFQICLDSACVSNNGFAAGNPYPICKANTTNTTNSTNPPPNATQVCYTTVTTIPANCTGTITSDTSSGTCRTIQCASGTNNIQILACDKPDSGAKTDFEMYRQSSAGTPPQICIGNTCMQNEGFKQSNSYPICSGSNATTNTTNTTTNSTNTTIPPAQTCYNSVQNIPASCSGGTITSDTFNGCRTIICTNGADNMKVQACDKTGYFELYKQSQSGNSIAKICIGGTCMGNGLFDGYAKSAPFPICIASNGTNATVTNSTGFNVTWIEPADNQMNTPPNFFHLNVAVPSDEANIPSTQWEIWNNSLTERVWSALNDTDAIRFHTHTADGNFEGSLAGATQLNFQSTYKVHVRFLYANGTFSPWSDWRTFTTSAQQFGNASQMWTVPQGFHIERFATGFNVPVHIAFAPPRYGAYPQSQQPYLYVTELYGDVKVVYRDGSSSIYADNLLNFPPFSSITGGGQMGVIGLYVDNVTGDLYVGTVYVDANNTIKNKVIHFTTSADGRTAIAQNTIIDNLPSAPSHQIEEITKGPDGKLYVQLGDGLNEQNAQNDSVLAGKIIRMNPDGSGVEIYAKGLRNPFGGDWRPGTNQLYATDNAPNVFDRLLRVTQGGNYLWGTGTNDWISTAIDWLNVSPVDVKFNRGGNLFPANLTGRLYVAVGGPIYTKGPTAGKEIWEYTLDTGGNITGKRHFLQYTGTGYGTPIGLDFGPDGLYFTDIYGEAGFISLGKTNANIYKIAPGDGPCVNCGSGTFAAGIQIIPWYPKFNATTNTVEYIFECDGIDGSGSYTYDFDAGDGNKWFNVGFNRIGPEKYPYANTNYTVSCTVHDQVSGQAKSASMIINPGDFRPETAGVG